jgi:hypothetical protein
MQKQKLNEYSKVVCKLAGIIELKKEKKHNIETNRRELGLYPKYEFITSHCLEGYLLTTNVKSGISKQ